MLIGPQSYSFEIPPFLLPLIICTRIHVDDHGCSMTCSISVSLFFDKKYNVETEEDADMSRKLIMIVIMRQIL